MTAQPIGSIFAPDAGKGRPPAVRPGSSATGRPGSSATGRPGWNGDGKASPKAVAEVIDDFQSDTAAIEARRDPFLARITLHLLALLIILLVLWASLSTIDRIVSASGKIVSSVPGMVVQPLETAVVKTVDVKAGDVVRKGQVLATLDPTFTEADAAQVEARLAGVKAQILRLEVEQAGREFLLPPNADDYLRLQHALWTERQSLVKVQLQGYEEKISRARVSLNKLENERNHFAQRLKVLKEIEGMRNSLAAAQVGSRLNSLLATDSRIEIERNLTLTANEMEATRHELQALLADRDVFFQQWQSKILEDLVARRNEAQGLEEQLVKANRRKDLVQLEAPDDAVVLEVAQRSVGSIIREAEPMVKLVPLNAPLEIDAEIDASDIGNVKVGDPVQIKLAAYSFLEHGMVDGEVFTISEDAFTTREGQTVKSPYYRARIRIGTTDTLYDMPPSFRLIPGMPLVAEIRVGERSVLSYFLRPITRGLKEGLREP